MRVSLEELPFVARITYNLYLQTYLAEREAEIELQSRTRGMI